MKEIWKEMLTVGRKQEISVDVDKSIVSPHRAGDTITKLKVKIFLLLLGV